MYQEAFKIRISDFAYNILDYDAQSFGFVRNGEESNLNGLINKLIPILLSIRKERRNLIHNTMDYDLEFQVNGRSIEILRNYLDTLVDKIYFTQEEYAQTLDAELWIRPSKESAQIFDEIKESELEICEQNLSGYLRGLLNEYIKLPQYKREQILFKPEFDSLIDSYTYDRICSFRYERKRYKGIVLQNVFYSTVNQDNYIIVYDIKNDKILSLLLYKISNVITTDKGYKIDKYIQQTFDKIYDGDEFTEKEYFDIVRSGNERK